LTDFISDNGLTTCKTDKKLPIFPWLTGYRREHPHDLAMCFFPGWCHSLLIALFAPGKVILGSMFRMLPEGILAACVLVRKLLRVQATHPAHKAGGVVFSYVSKD
jgi:hypothetical protein